MQDEVGHADEDNGHSAESIVEPLDQDEEDLGKAEESDENDDDSTDSLCESERARILLISARLAHLANVVETQAEEKGLQEEESGGEDQAAKIQRQESIDPVFDDKNATVYEVEEEVAERDSPDRRQDHSLHLLRSLRGQALVKGELHEVFRGSIKLVRDHEVDVEQEEELAAEKCEVKESAIERQVCCDHVLVDAIGYVSEAQTGETGQLED